MNRQTLKIIIFCTHPLPEARLLKGSWKRKESLGQESESLPLWCQHHLHDQPITHGLGKANDHGFLMETTRGWQEGYAHKTSYNSVDRGLPLPLGRGSARPHPEKGRSRHRKSIMQRVDSARRWIETMVSWSQKGPDHGVGVDPSLLTMSWPLS